MNFSHTEERRLIGEALGRWLRDQYDLESRQRAKDEPAGFSQDAWRALGELGVIAALVPEEHGGFGGHGYDITLVFEELGRALCVEPWLSSGLMATRLLSTCGDPELLLPKILQGECVVTLAYGEPESAYFTRFVQTKAVKVAGQWQLNGSKAVVLHGDSATHLLVTARTGDMSDGNIDSEDGISLFLVDANTNGMQCIPYETIDGFHAAEIHLENVLVPGSHLLGKENQAYADVAGAISAATLGVCAEALGAMEVALDITLDYLRTREQFGQPIGKFQALQHRMVDVATAIEQCRSLVIKAASVFDASTHERDMALAALKHYVGIAARLVAEEATQMHGGIGMAQETPISQYVKRLVMIDHMFGDTDHHLQQYVTAMRDSMAS